MELALPFGSKKVRFDTPYPPEMLAIARRQPRPEPCGWTAAAARALASPVGAAPLAQMRLHGKTAAIIADAAPGGASAHEILPTVMDHLNRAGARDDDITVVVTCDNGPPGDLQQQLGAEIARQYACVRHDPFSAESRFCGFSALGTPILANARVADADFRVAVGAVRPHASLGYSGGDAAILPGVSSFESIIRHGALIFAPNSSYGHLGDNPSALDAQNVGMSVGLDYILNYVMTSAGEPAATFAGDPVKAHRAAVNFGDRMVWGAELGGQADLAIASPGYDPPPGVPFDPRAIDFTASGVKPGGSIIFLAAPEQLPLPEDEWEKKLCDAPIDELGRMYEKRDWSGGPREIAAKLAAIRKAYFDLRPFFSRGVILVGSDLPQGALDRMGAEQTQTVQEAIEIATARHGRDAHVALVPDASTTLCLPEFH